MSLICSLIVKGRLAKLTRKLWGETRDEPWWSMSRTAVNCSPFQVLLYWLRLPLS